MKSFTSETPRRFDLVMAPHHGSIHSDPEKFAKWTNPKWVVISSGHGHDVSQVERVYRNQGADVLNTVTSGAIQATVQENFMTVRSWRNDPWRK